MPRMAATVKIMFVKTIPNASPRYRAQAIIMLFAMIKHMKPRNRVRLDLLPTRKDPAIANTKKMYCKLFIIAPYSFVKVVSLVGFLSKIVPHSGHILHTPSRQTYVHVPSLPLHGIP